MTFKQWSENVKTEFGKFGNLLDKITGETAEQKMREKEIIAQRINKIKGFLGIIKKEHDIPQIAPDKLEPQNQEKGSQNV